MRPPSDRRTRFALACPRSSILIALALAGLLAPASAVRPAPPRARPASAAATPAARPVRIDKSDAEGLTLGFTLPETTWVARPLGGGKGELQELRVRGLPGVARPRQPVLPTWGGWIVVPPGTRPVVGSTAENWAPVPARRLAVEPTPVMRRDPVTGEEEVSQELLLPGEKARGREIPSEAPAATGSELAGAAPASAAPGLRIGPPQLWRGRRIAPVTITALATDGQGNAARLLASATWQIRFVADKAAAPALRGAGPAPNGRGDDHFSQLFLNPEALHTWPTEGRAVGAMPPAATSPDGAKSALASASIRPAKALLAPEVRLTVASTRLYRVSASRLQTAGLLPADVRRNQIRLYQRRYNAADPAHYLEIEVPILMVGAGADTLPFGGTDAFVFYGLRPRDDVSYTADLGNGPQTVPGAGDPNEICNGGTSGGNVYWLAAADPAAGGWARFPVLALPPSSGSPLASYRRVDTLEEDTGYQWSVYHESYDRYHWNSPFDVSVSVPVKLYAPDPSVSTGQVRVSLWGLSSQTRRVRVQLLNGTTPDSVGTVGVQADSVVASSGPRLSGAWLAQSPTVTVQATRPDPSVQLSSYLDWVEIQYDALYRAVSDGLTFTCGTGTADRDIEVAGFTRTDLGVIEITNPHAPALVQLSGANLVTAGGATTLSLRVAQPTGAVRQFLAQADLAGAGSTELPTSRATLVAAPVDPVTPPVPPDVLVIAHPDFRAAVQRWADYRSSPQGGGLNVDVVSAQDVYDWFSGGLKDPNAIQRFCTYAVGAWGSWALLLVGDANENVRSLGVQNPIQSNCVDWVPSHYHASHASTTPELLASDKWFAIPSAGPTFPDDTTTPTEMLVGRFPCNNTSELGTMIDKSLAVEANQTGQPWRRRAIFVADDSWSYGYVATSADSESLNPEEHTFQVSEEAAAAGWGALADGAETPQRFYLSAYLDLHVQPGQTERGVLTFQQYTATEAVPALLGELSGGALLVEYQGHANSKVLAHENLVQDIRDPQYRQDVLGMTNAGRPWVFIGLGCHIADWARNVAGRGSGAEKASLAEKMLTQNGAACAAYASSGFEFLSPNARLEDVRADVWYAHPPRPFSGGGRTRWVLGELMQATEAEVLALYGVLWEYRQMAVQYCLLGDPLLALDCGPPGVTATLTDEGGATLPDGATVAALDSTNVRLVRVAAVDEAGVDRLELTGAESAVVTEQAPPPETNQRATYDVRLPVEPFDHSVALKVYDTADRPGASDPTTLTVRMPQTATIYLAGSTSPIVPGQVPFRPNVPLSFTAVVTSAAWLGPGQTLNLSGDHLTLSGTSVVRRDPHTVDLSFTATAPDSQTVARSVILTVGGHYATPYLLQSGPSAGGGYDIASIFAYPNPARGAVRFVIDTDAPPSGGRILLYTVAGRQIADLPVAANAFGDAPGRAGRRVVLVPWDGRDREGGAVANGVYLYRVELDAPGGSLHSGVQRLVMMK